MISRYLPLYFKGFYMPQTLIPNIHDFIATIDPFDKLPKDLQRKIAGCISINRNVIR